MGRINTDKLLKTVGDVYEAALDLELWPRAVNAIADMIDAGSTHLMVLDTKTGSDSLGLLEREDPAAHALNRLLAANLSALRGGGAARRNTQPD